MSAAVLVMVSRWRVTGINCFLIISYLRMQFMIMSKSAIDTVCMNIVIVGLAVTSLLESSLTMGESCSRT